MRSLLRVDAVRATLPLIVAIVVISLYTNAKNPNFLATSNIETIFVQASVLGVIAIGQTFLIAAGLMDLSVGAQAAMVGVIAATMVNDGHSETVAILVVLAVSAGIGLAWGALVAGLRIPPFILTLGGASLFSSLALRISKSSPVAARGRFRWLGNSEVLGLKTPVIVLLAALAVAALAMRYLRFGRTVYAVGSAEEAAYLAGLPAARTKVLCFVVSSTLAGVGGLIGMARISTGDPRVGGQLALQAIAAVVLGGASLAGGRGTPVGTVVGVLLLQVVSAALTFNNVKTYWNEAVFGGVLIVAVVVTAIADLRRSSGGSRLIQLMIGRRTPSPASAELAVPAAGGPSSAPPTIQPAAKEHAEP